MSLTEKCGLLEFENAEECIEQRASTVSSSQIASMAFYAGAAGMLCMVVFILVRKWDKVYQTRLEMPWIWVKPPKLNMRGLHVIWSWMSPVLFVSDSQLLKSSGLDALVFLRMISLCIQFLLPTTIVCCITLIPINMTGNVHQRTEIKAAVGGRTPLISANNLLKLSVYNLQKGSALLWVHTTVAALVVLWACFLLHYHYQSIVQLRQANFYVGGEQYNPWVQNFLCNEDDTSNKGQGEGGEPEDNPRGKRRINKALSMTAGLVKRMGTFILPTHLDDGNDESKCTMQRVRTPEAPNASSSEPPGHVSLSSAQFSRIPEREVDIGDAEDRLLGKPMSARTGLETMVPSMQKLSRSFTVNDKFNELGFFSGGEDDDLEEGGEGRQGAGDGSSYVYPWWKEQARGDNLPPLLGKPTVRFRKMVNVLTDDGTSFTTNAQHYAVLVRDLPTHTLKEILKELWYALYRVAAEDMGIGHWWLVRKLFGVGLSDTLILDEPGSVEEDKGSLNGAASTHSMRGVPEVSKPSLTTIRKRFAPWNNKSLGRSTSEASTMDMEESWDEREARHGQEQIDFVEKHFRSLFPDSFQQVVPVRKQKAVDYLMYQWDETVGALDRAEEVYERTGKRLKRYIGVVDNLFIGACVSWWGPGYRFCCLLNLLCCLFIGRRVDAIDYLRERKESLEEQIEEKRQQVLKGSITGNYFVLFNNQRDAAIATQTNLLSEGSRVFNVERAPGPDEINWSSLWVQAHWRRVLRRLLVAPFVLLLVVFPVSLFSACMAELDLAVCSDVAGDLYWDWYCTKGEFFRMFLTTLLPSVLLVAFEGLVMPIVLYYLTLARRSEVSYTQFELYIAAVYFYWNVFNMGLGSLLGGTIFAQFSVIVQDPSKTYTIFGKALGTQSNFFINYILLRTLCIVPLKMLYPHFNVIPGLFHALGIAKSRTPRQKAMQIAVHNLRYGREYGTVLLVFMVATAYSCVSPVILPAALGYYCMYIIVYRYQVLYVYERSYESGGMHWPFVFSRLMWCLWIFLFCTSCMLISMEAFVQGTLLLLFGTVFLFNFYKWCDLRYSARMHNIPLDVADAMPNAFVDPAMFLPPSLRPGSIGWYPEYGKCWEYWWMPLYTI